MNGAKLGAWAIGLAGLVLAFVVDAETARAQDDRTSGEAGVVRVGVFEIDASPRIGSPMAYDPCDGIQDPLSCRGIVLSTDQDPIVLCAVDWIGIGNGAHEYFRRRLADAVGTDPSRVAVHVLHQHDAPRADLTAAEVLAEVGLAEADYDVPWFRDVVDQAARAVRRAAEEAPVATHVGWAQAPVHEVASNRRILGEDGRVAYTRWTATADPAVRAMPVGTIDPNLKMLAFWNGATPIVALSWYATHPQSYYRTGLASVDFPGLARNDRQSETGVPHVHFNGAGGNITAGKWNDGSHENRAVLADRMADGMKRAWEALEHHPLTSDDVRWRSVAVRLPIAPHLRADELAATVADDSQPAQARSAAAHHLAWLRRQEAGGTVEIGCLSVGGADVLHMPGELFVEYQLKAQQMHPDRFVAMAAYGDYGPGYIGTTIAYDQGGYETGPGASRVAPDVQSVLEDAMRTLLSAEHDLPHERP